MPPAAIPLVRRAAVRYGVPRRDQAVPAAPSTPWGNLDLNLLIVFDAVMQDRNLTRAGRRLGLSQPATSHALARLRTMLHDELFVRTPDGMQPTPRAQQMAAPVHEALRTLSVTLEPDGFDPAQSVRSFTLAMNNHAARAIAPALLRRVAVAAPRVTLDIRPVGAGNVLDQLDSDGLDLAVSVVEDGGERFKCVRVMQDDYVAVLDRAHPAAAAPTLSLRHLAAIPHVIISSTGDDTSFIDEALEQSGLERRVAARVPFLSVMLVLVGSDCITVMPRRVARDLATICPVTVRELPFAAPQVSLSMIWHRRVDKHPAHRWLRDMVRRSVEA